MALSAVTIQKVTALECRVYDIYQIILRNRFPAHGISYGALVVERPFSQSAYVG